MKIQGLLRATNRAVPLVVWLGSLAGVVMLLSYRNQELIEPGLAVGLIQEISATETGRLTNVTVRMYDIVKQGDPIAVLKANTAAHDEFSRALLSSKKETAMAEFELLKAELISKEQVIIGEMADRQNETDQNHRRLAVDVEKARLEIIELKTQLGPDKILLADFQLELQVTKELLEKDAIESYEYKKVKIQYDMLAEKIKLMKEQLDEATENLALCQLRKDQFEQKAPLNTSLELTLEPLKKAIIAQQKRIAELFIESDKVVLVAPFDGIVNQIYCHSGQAVLQGEPIVTVAKQTPDHVVAWVDQNTPVDELLNREINLIKRDMPPKVMVSRISEFGPAIEMIPARLWRNPDIEEWGRPVIIPVHPDMGLLINEIVGIKDI